MQKAGVLMPIQIQNVVDDTTNWEIRQWNSSRNPDGAVESDTRICLKWRNFCRSRYRGLLIHPDFASFGWAISCNFARKFRKWASTVCWKWWVCGFFFFFFFVDPIEIKVYRVFLYIRCSVLGDVNVQTSKAMEAVFINSGDNPFEVITNSIK